MAAPARAPLDDRPLVLGTRDGGVLTLTLNRGERFNPLSLSMIQALQAEIDAAAADASVRAVVLAADGKGFCAGHDLKEMRAHASDTRWQRELFATSRYFFDIALVYALPFVLWGLFILMPWARVRAAAADPAPAPKPGRRKKRRG